MKKILCIAFLCFGFVVSASAATYTKYVEQGCATAGSDGTTTDCDGGADDAYGTIAEVNDFIKTTSTDAHTININFNKGDTWASQEPIGAESTWGSSIVPNNTTIVIDAYGTGADPIFQTNTMRFLYISDSDTISVSISNVAFTGRSSTYKNLIDVRLIDGSLTIDGLDADGSVTPSGTDPENIINFRSISGAVEILNCNIHDFGAAVNPTNNSTDSNAITGGFVIGDTHSTPSSVKIHDNTIHSMQGDGVALSGLQFTGGSNKAEIYDNTIYDCGEQAIDFKGVKNVEIYRNTLYRDGWALGGTGGGGAIIVVSNPDQHPGYKTEDISIYDNYFNGNTLDTNETQNTIVFGHSSAGVFNIYNNYFHNTFEAVIDSGYGEALFYNNLVLVDTSITNTDGKNEGMRLESSQARAYNNTIVDTSSSIIYGVRITNASAIAQNNIVYLTKTNSYAIYANGVSPTVDYNIYYNPNDTERVYYNATPYYHGVNFDVGDSVGTDWLEIVAHENDLSDNPDFTIPGTDHTLTSASPAINSGVDLGASYDDGWGPDTSLPPVTVTTLDQDSYDSWEIGAYVYGSSTTSTVRGITIK